ncbi:winged helix-turn-helix domain-containing protein [Brevibacillus agri]|uniref:ArsR/SmtB family transcription factor n=1 Tax=Brevibacillus agri TaxID=51101 RepID=UPI002E1C1E5B|nr:winged helix-turn-helix domain-containing protein [Brevibacillus agri]
MNTSPNIAEIASLIGEPSRVSMLVSLMGGKALPASELARLAKITPQTASTHLAKLVEGGLLQSESHGRHRYYRLASPEVAHAMEALLTIANPVPVRSLRESEQLRVLRYARTCYDHLAGEVGVALTQKMIELRLLEASGQDFVLNEAAKLSCNHSASRWTPARKADGALPANAWTGANAAIISQAASALL